jgi:hypothetical protein
MPAAQDRATAHALSAQSAATQPCPMKSTQQTQPPPKTAHPPEQLIQVAERPISREDDLGRKALNDSWAKPLSEQPFLGDQCTRTG